MALSSRFVDVEALSWGPSPFAGIERKELLDEPATGLQTALFRMEPGATLPYHEHVRLEQSFILEGSLDDDEGSATAGNFVWRPPGSRHTAWAGREGALALGFFLTPNDFLDEAADSNYDVSAGESDGTVTPHAADHDHLPPLASRFVSVESLPWADLFEGVETKTLMDQPQVGLRMSLVRMAPGAVLPYHEHVELEQSYVLRGSLDDDEGSVTAGNYVSRPAGSRHTAWAGDDGCLVLDSSADSSGVS